MVHILTAISAPCQASILKYNYRACDEQFKLYISIDVEGQTKTEEPESIGDHSDTGGNGVHCFHFLCLYVIDKGHYILKVLAWGCN